MKKKKKEEKEQNPKEKKTEEKRAEEEEEELSSLSVPHSLFTSFSLQNFSQKQQEPRTVLRFCLVPGAGPELPKF